MGEKASKGSKVYNFLKRLMFVLWGIVAILLVVILIRNNKMPKREELTLDEYIAFTIIESLGKTNDKKERFVGSDELDGYKRFFINMDGHYDNEYQVNKSISQTIEVLSKLITDKEFYETDFNGISFQWMITVINDYGVESDIVGCIITIDKPELYKIVWENVTREGFVNIAKTFWVHKLLLE